MKVWEINFEGHEIRVENRTDSERLYINSKLCDEGFGIASRAKLIGKLWDGRLVKVNIGGTFGIRCDIWVDNDLILKG